jgi:predicted alpha/beta superfamily hydrolase
MKKISLVYFLFFCLYNVNTQNNNDIVIGKIDSINSKILNEQRKIWVYVPDGNSDGAIKNKNYPVIYLLDGATNFHSVVGMIQQLSSVNSVVPKLIVVGIPNTNRTRDLTPTKVEPNPPYISRDVAANSGGGDKFISFIEKELIPYIDSNYPTDPYRIFIGHSFGGLTVMNTLTEKPELFNSYVAIDPIMSWDNEKLLKTIKKKTFAKKYNNKKLFLGIANTMSEGMDILDVQKDTTFETENIRSLLELNSFLNKNTQKQFSFKGKYYAKDDHYSVALITEYDALRFIFDFYQLKLYYEDYLNPESDIFSKIKNHYKLLSKEFSKKINPDEEYINGLGGYFMSVKQFRKAEDFFNLNVINYPKSFNVYDSLGDLYVEIGDKKRAIENFRKAISLNSEFEMSTQKLKALEKD